MSIDNEVSQAVQSGKLIKDDTIHRWISESTDNDVASLAWLGAEHSELLSDLAIVSLASHITNHLARFVLEETGELSEAESLAYMGRLFQLLWGLPIAEPVLRTIKQHFALMLKGWPATGHDMVILVVLEHLFTTPSVRQYFFSWASDPELTAAFHEAARLSNTDG